MSVSEARARLPEVLDRVARGEEVTITFITNNRRDFPDALTDIDVTYPDTLPDPAPG